MPAAITREITGYLRCGMGARTQPGRGANVTAPKIAQIRDELHYYWYYWCGIPVCWHCRPQVGQPVIDGSLVSIATSLLSSGADVDPAVGDDRLRADLAADGVGRRDFVAGGRPSP